MATLTRVGVCEALPSGMLEGGEVATSWRTDGFYVRGKAPATTAEPTHAMEARVVLLKAGEFPREPRRTSTVPGPAVSVPRTWGSVGDSLSVLGRWGPCQTRHVSLRARALVVLPQAHGEPAMAKASNGKTPWPRSFGLKLPDLKGSQPSPAERRGRARRSSRQRRRDDSLS